MFARQRVAADHLVRVLAMKGEGIGVRAISRRLQTYHLVFVTLCDGFVATGSSLRDPTRVHPGRPQGSTTTISVSALYGRGHPLLRA